MPIIDSVKVKKVKGGPGVKIDGFVAYAVGHEGQTAKSFWSADENFARQQAIDFFERGWFMAGHLLKGIAGFLFGPNDTYL